MKVGKSLVELATEIERQSKVKKDYVVPTQKLVAVPVERDVKVEFVNGEKQSLAVQPYAHQQIADRLGIPFKYYQRLKEEAPALLATNVNHWFQANPEKRLVRVLSDKEGNPYIRAFLSDRFRALDYADLLEVVFPVLQKLGVLILSADVTETRFYIKAVDSRITLDVPKGAAMGDGGHTIFDTLSPAITIRDSEVGHGALSVDQSIFTKACTNLGTFDKVIRKTHVGRRGDFGDEVTALLSDETRQADDKALWLKVRDVVQASFEQAKFAATVDKIKGTALNKITAPADEVVEVTAQRFGFNEEERGSVLKHLIEGADLSQYGLANAITRTAEDLDDYDRASSFESFGGKLFQLPKSEWARIGQKPEAPKKNEVVDAEFVAA